MNVNRVEVGGGLFVTTNILLKAELVKETYDDFPTTDIRNGGKFSGFMIEGDGGVLTDAGARVRVAGVRTQRPREAMPPEAVCAPPHPAPAH